MTPANSTVQPAGWLAKYIDTQFAGLTGHMAAAGFPFDRTFWGAESIAPYPGTAWWPYEQTAYYIDGFTRAAILTGDADRIARAEAMIYPVLRHPDAEGYLGPAALKHAGQPHFRWPHVVFFRACLALYEHNGDPAIPQALTRHYLGHSFDYSAMRDILNIEIMLELHRHTGNEALLRLARETYDTYNAPIEGYRLPAIPEDEDIRDVNLRTGRKLYVHGVSFHEYAKLGALLYRATGEKRYLAASVGAYKKIQKHYLLPGGCSSSTERLTSKLPEESYETCDIADMSWSLHYMAQITDEPLYADLLEDCVLNAGIGSVTEDFKALQYFSSGNQLVLTADSSTAIVDRGNSAMAYGPMPYTACCPGNVNRIIPNYILHMWDVQGSTLTARLYGPSTVTGAIDGKAFSVTTETAYPFDLTLHFTVETAAPLTLRLRLPGWATGYTLTGAEHRRQGNYLLVDLTKAASLTLTFAAAIEQRPCGTGVYFRRGPLVYALGQKGERSITKTAACDGVAFPTYAMLPNKPWNYAVDTAEPANFIPGSETAWDMDGDIPRLEITGRLVENWRLRRVKSFRACNWNYRPVTVHSPRTFTPRLPRRTAMKLAETPIRLTLYPYGAAKLRMTVLPVVKKTK